MNKAFLQHQWLAFWRSKNTGKSIIVSILLALTMLYLFANLLIASFFLDKILDKVFPERSMMDAFNGLLLYYFLFDLLMRFQLQELPTLSVKPYLNLPISRNQIVNYLSITSLWSGFNLSPFLLTVPFLMKVLLFEGRVLEFLGTLISIAGLTLFNHFFSIWLKRKVNMNAWFILAFFCTLAGIILLDFYSDYISISRVSREVFNSILHLPFLALFPVALGASMYFINDNFLKSNLYLDELQRERSGQNSVTDIPFLKRFGIAGDLAALEIKLILRNKRPKSTLIMSCIFMFYGLMFYRNRQPDETIMIVAGMMMTGIFIINYGQFMFSWQSAHFDGILAQKISAEDFYKSKFVLFTLFATLALLVTTPYGYFGWKILLTNCMLYLWNIGVSSVIVLAFANRNYKYIDLSKGSSFNWEGVGASQFIIGIPLFVTPVIIYLLISSFFNPIAGILALGFIGLGFILARQFWINKLTESFKRKRYTIAEGFRNH
ncbi:DUF5687 family protein [Pedobacter sp. P351]|uniref:DUF5687 family protein n=1 Tax=Pedobacter superstes TaxID=3133441 RepID=UPI0030A94791